MNGNENDKAASYVQIGNLLIRAGERLGVPTVVLIIILIVLNNLLNSLGYALQHSIGEVNNSVRTLTSKVEIVIRENSNLKVKVADLERRMLLLERQKKR